MSVLSNSSVISRNVYIFLVSVDMLLERLAGRIFDKRTQLFYYLVSIFVLPVYDLMLYINCTNFIGGVIYFEGYLHLE